MMTTLLREDFASFPVGRLPSCYLALGEYHFLTPDRSTHPWYEATVSHAWRPALSAWVVIEDKGRHRLLQVLEDMVPIPRVLAAGDFLWSDYTLRVRVQLLKVDSGFAGIVFRGRHSRQHYRLVMAEGRLLRLLKEDHEESVVLAECSLDYDTDAPRDLFASVRGDRIEAGIDGRTMLTATDSSYAHGNVGLIARSPAAFDSVLVETDGAGHGVYVRTRSRLERELDEERAKYPKPVLWRRIDTRGFGTGRHLRFGHLLGRDRLDILSVQHVKLETSSDAYSALRCLTAFDLDGNLLWQHGEPSSDPDAALVTCDLPCQIYDVDGDGRDEVIVLKSFRLTILDGRDGSVKNEVAVPKDPAEENRFGRLLGDVVLIANFRGKDRPSDILVKNRYSQVWAYDSELNLLWTARRPEGKHRALTGHFPLPFDVDGDGHGARPPFRRCLSRRDDRRARAARGSLPGRRPPATVQRGPRHDGRRARRDPPLGPELDLDLHAGPALPGGEDLRPGSAGPLQRFELPRGDLPAGMAGIGWDPGRPDRSGLLPEVGELGR